MPGDQADVVQMLGMVYRMLSRVRGAVRARRRSHRFWGIGAMAGTSGNQLVDTAARLLTEQVPVLAMADWEAVRGFPETPVTPVTPVRLGTVRVGSGPGQALDLPVLVPLLAGGHVAINSAEADALAGEIYADTVASIIGSLVLRVLATTRPGSVSFVGDGWLPEFLLRDSLYQQGLVDDVVPEGLGYGENLLVRLRQEVHQRSIARDGWRVLVLGELGHLSAAQLEELHWVLRVAPERGLHAILVDTVLPHDVPAETVLVGDHGVRVSTTGPLLDVRPDAVPAPGTPAWEALEELFGQLRPPALSPTQLRPATIWTESSQHGLYAEIGDVDGTPTGIRLGDAPPHALVGGPSGSGKTNLIYGVIAGLATRYSPDEVELYLLDFKESVSFAPFAPSRRRPDWLPHARLVGLNVNDDREFGLALLRHLRDVLKQRAAAAKQHDVVDLAALRQEDPSGRWPRLVTVIDEFQVLLAGRDSVTEEAVALLEDLARRGRSFGLHLVLASQDVSAIEALWGRPALVGQLTLRVALPRATGVLANDNSGALDLADHHAILNAESGVTRANQVVRLPWFDPPFLDTLRSSLWQQDPRRSAPVVFDGDAVPHLSSAGDYLTLGPNRVAVALVGREMSVTDRAARVRLDHAPGRCLAVLGTRQQEACDVLTSAILSLARQQPPGTAQYTLIAVGDGGQVAAAQALHAALTADRHLSLLVDQSAVTATLAGLATTAQAALTGDSVRMPHCLAFFAVDASAALLRAVDPRTGRSGHEDLRQIMTSGPEIGLHTLAWWRTPQRMKDDLGGFATQLDEIGSWVALDVQGADLAVLPGGQLLTWYPRHRRALWFDRAVHDRPRPIIPFATDLTPPEVPA